MSHWTEVTVHLQFHFHEGFDANDDAAKCWLLTTDPPKGTESGFHDEHLVGFSYQDTYSISANLRDFGTRLDIGQVRDWGRRLATDPRVRHVHLLAVTDSYATYVGERRSDYVNDWQASHDRYYVEH